MLALAQRRRSSLPLYAVCIAVFVWSFGPLIVRGATVSSLTFAFWRLWLAVPIMWTAAYLLGGRPSLAVFRRALVPGVFFGASMLLGFVAFKHTSVANATLIPALTPAVVLLLAGRLFGERRSRRQLLLAAVAFVGVTVVVFSAGSGGEASRGGDLAALANLAVWTAYFVMAKQIRNENSHAWALIATFFTLAAITVTPFCLVMSDDLGASTPKDWGLYLLMILVPGLVGHGLMTWAQRDVDISVSSLLTLANAPLSMVGAWLLYGQSLRWLQIVGVLLVIGSLAMIAIDQAPTPARPDRATRRAQAAEPVAAADR